MLFYSFDVVICYSVVFATSLVRVITLAISFLCIPAASFNSKTSILNLWQSCGEIS